MATYSATSHLTQHTGAATTATPTTVFQVSSSNPTYLSGVFVGSNGSGTDNCEIVITPTAGNLTITGSIIYRISGLNAATIGSATILCSNITVAAFSPSGASTGLLNPSIVAGIAATQSGVLTFNRLLLPPAYYVQVLSGSGSTNYRWSLTQEEIY